MSVSVLHVVVFLRLGEQKVMSGELAVLPDWCRMCVYCSVLLRMKSELSCSANSNPLLSAC